MTRWLTGILSFLREPFIHPDSDYNIEETTDMDQESAVVAAWAKEHGYEYHYDSLFDASNVPPLIAKSDIEPISHEVRGKIGTHTFVLFRYTNSYYLGSMGNAEFHKWIMAFQSHRALPGFVVDGHNRNKLRKNFSDFDKLSLEGKFAEKFSIYAPKGDHIDVLSVMTPDIMWRLYSKHPYIDIIVAGKRVWVMMNGGGDFDWGRTTDDILNQLSQILTASEDMITELEHQAKTYRQSRAWNDN